MKRKYPYIPPQELKRRIWMNTTARFLAAIDFFSLYFMWWSGYELLLLGVIFLLLTPVTYFTREPERNSKIDVFCNWIFSFAMPTVFAFTGNTCGLWLLAANTSTLLACLLILYKPFYVFKKQKK